MVVGLEPTSSEITDWLQQIVLSHLSYTIFLTTYNNKYTTFLSNKKINLKLSTKKRCIFVNVIGNPKKLP